MQIHAKSGSRPTCIQRIAIGQCANCLDLAGARDRSIFPWKPREPSRSSNFGNTPTRNNTLMRVLSSSVVCNPRQYAGEEAEEAEERDATARDGEARGSERYVGTSGI